VKRFGFSLLTAATVAAVWVDCRTGPEQACGLSCGSSMFSPQIEGFRRYGVDWECSCADGTVTRHWRPAGESVPGYYDDQVDPRSTIPIRRSR
jgi:hypothetical protein